MAETDLFPDIGWDYPLDIPVDPGTLRQKAGDGSVQSRIQRPDLRLFELVRRSATTDQREQIEAFHRRLQADFFRFDHKVWVNDGGTLRPRSFPVMFAGPPQIGLAHNDTWPISVTLIEAVGKALPTTELAVNGTFDTDIANWNTNLNGSAGGTFTWDAGTFKFLQGTNSVWMLAAQAVSLVQGRTYQFVAERAGVSSGGRAYAGVATTSEATVGIPDVVSVPWDGTRIEKQSAAFVAPSTGTFYLKLREGSPKARFSKFDNISLLEVSNYPDPNLGHPSFFIEETEGVVIAGTWTEQTNGNAHGGTWKFNAGTVTTEAFQWLYGGYGFRLWFPKAASWGIVQVFLDEVSLGTVDLYNATTLASAALFTKLDVPLGLHRVKLQPTNTKNAASTDFIVVADAIEVMP